MPRLATLIDEGEAAPGDTIGALCEAKSGKPGAVADIIPEGVTVVVKYTVVVSSVEEDGRDPPLSAEADGELEVASDAAVKVSCDVNADVSDIVVVIARDAEGKIVVMIVVVEFDDTEW